MPYLHFLYQKMINSERNDKFRNSHIHIMDKNIIKTKSLLAFCRRKKVYLTIPLNLSFIVYP